MKQRMQQLWRILDVQPLTSTQRLFIGILLALVVTAPAARLGWDQNIFIFVAEVLAFIGLLLSARDHKDNLHECAQSPKPPLSTRSEVYETKDDLDF